LIIAREFLVTGLRQIAVEAGQVLAADRLGKWKTTFQLTYVITALVWISFSEFSDRPWLFEQLWKLAKPVNEGGWLMAISLWLAVALTVISGANYIWSSRGLLMGKR
ncbi:MAG: CDP-diacylglycerol--glycerol-3-phosphate 3-phosphatidyltransferase, partial [Akkermansiaceae bacterium]|nr:CDP-diacylglycerol--glycerol-3-phosphate 3-phosphatidyltransferase [Akkermansiaceae bacterium]